MKTKDFPNINTTGKHKVNPRELFVPKDDLSQRKYLSPEYIDYNALTLRELGSLRNACGVDAVCSKGYVTYTFEGHNIWSNDPDVEIDDIFNDKNKELEEEDNTFNKIVPNF